MPSDGSTGESAAHELVVPRETAETLLECADWALTEIVNGRCYGIDDEAHEENVAELAEARDELRSLLEETQIATDGGEELESGTSGENRDFVSRWLDPASSIRATAFLLLAAATWMLVGLGLVDVNWATWASAILVLLFIGLRGAAYEHAYTDVITDFDGAVRGGVIPTDRLRRSRGYRHVERAIQFADGGGDGE